MQQSSLKTFSALLTAVAVALSLGCTSSPTHTAQIRDESPSGKGQAIVLGPTYGNGFATTVLGSGERMWIRQSELLHARVVCSSGSPVRCERIGMRSYCQCHGPRNDH